MYRPAGYCRFRQMSGVGQPRFSAHRAPSGASSAIGLSLCLSPATEQVELDNDKVASRADHRPRRLGRDPASRLGPTWRFRPSPPDRRPEVSLRDPFPRPLNSRTACPRPRPISRRRRARPRSPITPRPSPRCGYAGRATWYFAGPTPRNSLAFGAPSKPPRGILSLHSSVIYADGTKGGTVHG